MSDSDGNGSDSKLDREFMSYLSLAERFVRHKDLKRCQKWFEKLCSRLYADREAKKRRNAYLIRLLIALHKNRLEFPFNQEPPVGSLSPPDEVFGGGAEEDAAKLRRGEECSSVKTDRTYTVLNPLYSEGEVCGTIAVTVRKKRNDSEIWRSASESRIFSDRVDSSSEESEECSEPRTRRVKWRDAKKSKRRSLSVESGLFGARNTNPHRAAPAQRCESDLDYADSDEKVQAVTSFGHVTFSSRLESEVNDSEFRMSPARRKDASKFTEHAEPPPGDVKPEIGPKVPPYFWSVLDSGQPNRNLQPSLDRSKLTYKSWATSQDLYKDWMTGQGENLQVERRVPGLFESFTKPIGLHEAALDQTVLYETSPNRARLFETSPNRTGLFETLPHRTGLFETSPNQTGLFETSPNRTGLLDAAPNRQSLFESSLDETGLFETSPNRITEPFKQIPEGRPQTLFAREALRPSVRRTWHHEKPVRKPGFDNVDALNTANETTDVKAAPKNRSPRDRAADADIISSKTYDKTPKDRGEERNTFYDLYRAYPEVVVDKLLQLWTREGQLVVADYKEMHRQKIELMQKTAMEDFEQKTRAIQNDRQELRSFLEFKVRLDRLMKDPTLFEGSEARQKQLMDALRVEISEEKTKLQQEIETNTRLKVHLAKLTLEKDDQSAGLAAMKEELKKLSKQLSVELDSMCREFRAQHLTLLTKI